MKAAPARRFLVLVYSDDITQALPISDESVLTIDGQSYAMLRCTSAFIDDDPGLLDVFDDPALD